MTPQERLQAHLEARTKLGGGPAVRADANGNPVFVPLRRTFGPEAIAVLAQITIEDGETK